jgi:hypothetical protein
MKKKVQLKKRERKRQRKKRKIIMSGEKSEGEEKMCSTGQKNPLSEKRRKKEE